MLDVFIVFVAFFRSTTCLRARLYLQLAGNEVCFLIILPLCLASSPSFLIRMTALNSLCILAYDRSSMNPNGPRGSWVLEFRNLVREHWGKLSIRTSWITGDRKFFFMHVLKYAVWIYILLHYCEICSWGLSWFHRLLAKASCLMLWVQALHPECPCLHLYLSHWQASASLRYRQPLRRWLSRPAPHSLL